MSPHTRRAFIIGAGGGVAAGVAGASTTHGRPDAAHASQATGDISADNPLVAYVRDVRSGEISVMAGDREVVVTDRALAARLAKEIR